MAKTITLVIETCEECPHYQEEVASFVVRVLPCCGLTGDTLFTDEIPKDCPLE